MAKKRDWTVHSLKVTDQGAELKCKIGFSLKMFEGDVAQDHVANYDLTLSRAKLEHLIISTLTIDSQKVFREAGSHGKVREMTSKTLLTEDIYPKSKEKVEETPEQTIMKLRKKGYTKEQIIAMLEDSDEE